MSLKVKPRFFLSLLWIFVTAAACVGPAAPLPAGPTRAVPAATRRPATVIRPAAAPSATPTPDGPQIVVEPARSLNDAPLRIRLSGLPPEQPVTVSASLGRVYASSAGFVTDAQGRVDLGTQAPESGSYAVSDAMGLLWAARPRSGVENVALDNPAPPDDWEPTTVYPITFTVESGGDVMARTTVQRLLVDPTVTRQVVRGEGLVGTFYRPAGPGPFPALIVLGGSEGGLHEGPAMILASHGFATLALAYIRMGDLPENLNQIPLEYFERAMAWLAGQDGVDGARLGVIGNSVGGQLALLLGATFPQVKSVVAYVPCNVVSEGDENGAWSGQSRFTYGDNPLTFVWGHTLVEWDDLYRAHRQSDADVQTALSATADEILADYSFDDAAIAVEKIKGPVLLISAVQDDSWPSTLFAELAMRRLKQYGHPYPDQHLIYEHSGHAIFVGMPFGASVPDPWVGPGLNLTFGGGDEAATAAANADSWPKVLDFLAGSLGNR